MSTEADWLQEDEHKETADSLFREGDLSWMLDDHQLVIYEAIRAWEVRRLAEPTTGASRIFMLDAGRQVGKTFTVDLIKVEDCIRRPKSRHLIASATAVGLKEFVIPNIEVIITQAPDDVRPRLLLGHKGMRTAFWFPNGSVLKLVGIDKNPDELRGPALHGAVVSEAAFVRYLKRVISSVIYPQFTRDPNATLILESSAPKDVAHDFDQVFLPDCQRRKAYVFMTIDDNTAITQEQKDELVNAAREIDPDDAEREYYGRRVRNRADVIIPEFDKDLHVLGSVRPDRAICMAALDPGMRDLFALLWGYWDFPRAKLVVEAEYCERNASTAAIADVIRETETRIYGEFNGFQASYTDLQAPSGFPYWDGIKWRSNPVQRISDTEARTIGDLIMDHGIAVQNTLKDDKEAALNALRHGFRSKKIEIHPRCVNTIAHVNAARWNEQRTDYERTRGMGHYDLLDALVYLWRMIQPIRNQNPFPPAHVDRNDRNVLFQEPPAASNHQLKGLVSAFGGRRANWR